MDLEEQLIYGQRAAEILDNPVWKDIWTKYEQQITEKLMQTPVSDVDALQKAVQALQLMANLRRLIESSLTTGKLAQIQLREKTIWEQAKSMFTNTSDDLRG